jgi:hypothetical protein
MKSVTFVVFVCMAALLQVHSLYSAQRFFKKLSVTAREKSGAALFADLRIDSSGAEPNLFRSDDDDDSATFRRIAENYLMAKFKDCQGEECRCGGNADP